MVEMAIFWSVMGVVLAIFGFYLIDHTNRRGKDCTVLGIALLTVGILIAVGAELNLYVSFTEQEIKEIDERYWAFAVPVEEG